MGIINVFNTLSNEKKAYNANGKLKNIFPKMDFKHSIILKAGNRVDENYEVNSDDVLYCRIVPGSATVMAVIGIVTAVVAVGVGVGTAIYAKKKSAEAQEKMEKAQRDADNLAQSVSQLPFVRGAKNSSALGRPIQFVMGDVYNTPYTLSTGFYSVDGTNGVNSYYNVALSFGNREQVVKDILIGEEKIITSETDAGIYGVTSFDEDSLYYEEGADNKVEVRRGNDSFVTPNFNYKVSSTYALSELKHEFGEDAVPVIVQAAQNAHKVQVCIQFSSLRQYNSDAGTWEQRLATVRPYWSNDAGNTWNEFYFQGMNNNSVSLNVNHTVRFVAEKTFSAAESFGKQISIKVVKDTPKSESNSQEDCSLLWYQTFCYDAKTSNSTTLTPCLLTDARTLNNTCRIAFRIKSSESTKDILDELHGMNIGKAHVYDEDNDDWETFTTTRNPAAWIKELLTTDFHSPSLYSDEELDLDSFADLFQYCEENSFYTDGIICEEETKNSIIEKILSSVNSDLIINNQGKLSIITDKEEINPVALINDENIISFTYSKDLNRRVTGEKVTYINRKTWKPDTFYAMLDGGDFDYETDVVEPISFDYVTDYEHAYKMAQRKMRQRQLMPFELKCEVGPEGYNYPIYSLVKAQITMLQQGIRSSVIKSLTIENGEITRIFISDLVNFEANKRYGITIQATTPYGHQLYNVEVTGNGKTKALILETPIVVGNKSPVVGNHLSFGLLDDDEGFTKVTNLFKIYGIEPNGENYTLTLRTYNPDVYSYGGNIPAYKSNLTPRQKPSSSVSIEQLNQLRQDMNVIQEDLINAYQAITMPVVVDADNKQYVFELNSAGHTVGQTQFSTQIYCRQGSEDRKFVIGDIVLPDGWSYTVSSGKITFTVPDDTEVQTQSIKIPVIATPAISYANYVDQDGNQYVNEIDAKYVREDLDSSPSTYYIYFSVIGKSSAYYLGKIGNTSDIPNVPLINAFFTWSGDNISSTLVLGGTFKKSAIYKYIGGNLSYKWTLDEDVSHFTIAANDIYSIANDDLESNNSLAYEYLEHLTATSVFAKFAVIEDLIAGNIEVPAGCITVGTKTLITNNKITADLIDANSIFAQEITVSTTGRIKSANYVEGKSGFNIEGETGIIEVQDGKFNGDIVNGAIETTKDVVIPFTFTGEIDAFEYAVQEAEAYEDTYNGWTYTVIPVHAQYYDENGDWQDNHWLLYRPAGGTPFEDFVIENFPNFKGYYRHQVTISGSQGNKYNKIKLNRIYDMDFDEQSTTLDTNTLWEENGYLHIKKDEDVYGRLLHTYWFQDGADDDGDIFDVLYKELKAGLKSGGYTVAFWAEISRENALHLYPCCAYIKGAAHDRITIGIGDGSGGHVTIEKNSTSKTTNIKYIYI